MQINASTKSKAMKRGADKAIAKTAGIECCLSQMCGSLHLDATSPADLNLLTMMYKHVFSYAEKGREYCGARPQWERGFVVRA
jgi:hypothetical protein